MASASDTATNVLIDYLTKNQLAAQINKSPRTLDRLHQAGEGPPRTKIGRTTLYRRDAVIAWLRSHELRRSKRSRGGRS